MEWPVHALTSSLVHRERMPTDRASRIAQAQFGIRGGVRPLTGERDENFHVRAEDGSEHLLKISHPDEDPGTVDLVAAALRHIEARDPALPCPRLRPTLAGGHVGQVVDARGTTRLVRLVSWLPGLPLRDAPPSPALRRRCGDVAARLALALSDFRHPSGVRPVIWDVGNASCLPALMDDMPAFAHRAFVTDYVRDYLSGVGAGFASLPRQIVHNDLNAGNLLVDPADPETVAAIIDFGDMVETALVADAAVAAATHVTDAADASASLRDFLDPYRAKLPLGPAELEALPWLIGIRKLMGVVIPRWYRLRNPADTHYGRISSSSDARNVAIAARMASVRLT
ncbi:Homoserine kinase [Methylobacterium crusticola]|uniref:Homoserine kinase n=1 Tax=Methylobacterium crusticola TaxID=1697972 RepID=A0ABQ4R4G2_9HYPH|nr:phosphotransferase [Methylobacterium crusticola]GJD52542.1 Homoserine kinase [Methylobacterium crusticola]